ncbi:hypothetical protein [Ekhidna sp.]|uniref:hypothetical protein n=1 Tax=Ekhidna sp. TaxID=2608089 RepID=UPI003C7E534B
MNYKTNFGIANMLFVTESMDVVAESDTRTNSMIALCSPNVLKGVGMNQSRL